STPEPSAREQDRYRVRQRRSVPAPSRCLARSPPCPVRRLLVLCLRTSATTTISGWPRGLTAIWAERERAFVGSFRRHVSRRAHPPPPHGFGGAATAEVAVERFLPLPACRRWISLQQRRRTDENAG